MKLDETKSEIAMAPIMLFMEDVKSIGIGDIHESQSSFLEKYKLINRKQEFLAGHIYYRLN